MSNEQIIGHVSWSPDFKSEDRKLPKHPVNEDIIDLINRGAIQVGIAPSAPRSTEPVIVDEAEAALRPHQDGSAPITLIGPSTCNDVVLHFTYSNWKGEVSRRRAHFTLLQFGANEWHPDPQFLVYGYDLDKQAPRTYALRDMTDITVVSH